MIHWLFTAGRALGTTYCPLGRVMQQQHWSGLFAVITFVLAGAASERLLKLPNDAGIYLTIFAVAIIGWWIGRRSSREQERS